MPALHGAGPVVPPPSCWMPAAALWCCAHGPTPLPSRRCKTSPVRPPGGPPDGPPGGCRWMVAHAWLRSGEHLRQAHHGMSWDCATPQLMYLQPSAGCPPSVRVAAPDTSAASSQPAVPLSSCCGLLLDSCLLLLTGGVAVRCVCKSAEGGVLTDNFGCGSMARNQQNSLRETPLSGPLEAAATP